MSSAKAFGYATAGMNVTLAGNPWDSGATDIHTTPTPVSGNTYAPNGRLVSPLSATSAYDNADSSGFSAFNNSPNGVWTIFLADLSSGGQSQLVSWDLNINGVPEPVNVALGIFAGVFLVTGLARNRQVRNRVHQLRAAVMQWIDAV